MHVRGRALPDETEIELWIVDGHISAEPVAGADTVFGSSVFKAGSCPAWSTRTATSGSADHGEIPLDDAIVQAEAERDVGALLLRDCGSPTDTRSLDDRDDLPRIIRAGKHLARPKRYQAGFSVELEDESQLPAAVAHEARRGDGWIKLVGDWIDRSVGDLAPLWSDDVLKAAIDTAHAHGARVTAHVFSDEAHARPDQGRDRLHRTRHRAHRRHHRADARARNRVGPHPDQHHRELPRYRRGGEALPDLRRAHARPVCRVAPGGSPRRVDAGVPIYAGSDAGSMIAHGRIADEVEALKGIGMSPTEALGAACWDARDGWAGPAWITGLRPTWCATRRTRGRVPVC